MQLKAFSAIKSASVPVTGGSVPLMGPSVPLTGGSVPLPGLFQLFVVGQSPSRAWLLIVRVSGCL